MAAPEHGNGTITAGGTAQVLLAADGDRAYLLIQNNSDEDMWIKFGGATPATDAGLKIPAGGAGEWVQDQVPAMTQAIKIIGATTGKKFGYYTDKN